VIAEAIDTAFTLGWAFLIWLVLVAFFAGAALYAAVVTAACACRAVWRGITAALAAVQRPDAPELPRTPPVTPQARTEPHGPSWARTETEEAA